MTEGYTEDGLYTDGYGYYADLPEGRTLAAVDMEDDRETYEVAEGTVRIAADAFDNTEWLKTVGIPSSVTVIEEGALSNGRGWADPYKGIETIILSPENKVYFTEGDYLWEKTENGLKLFRYLAEDNEAVIPQETAAIARKAFFNRKLSFVRVPAEDVRIRFPEKHGFYLENLLSCLGKNALMYDFADYDRFITTDYFNCTKLLMLTDRLSAPLRLADETAEVFRQHVLSHVEETAGALIREDGIETLEALADCGLVTAENADEFIELFNKAGKTALLSYAMNYKNEHFRQTDAFDFPDDEWEI